MNKVPQIVIFGRVDIDTSMLTHAITQHILYLENNGEISVHFVT